MATLRRALTAAALTALMLLCGAATALADPPKGGATDAAKNLADQLTSWAGLIIIPIAAIVSLPSVARRDVGQAFVVLLVVTVVGSFAFNAAGVQSFVTNVAKTVLG